VKRQNDAMPRLLCIYQHAPTPGAPGIYRHRMLLSGLAERGWDVDLVSTAVNYMTGRVPARYARRLYLRESIDGVVHHWVWASGRIHDSLSRRALNYATFAATATARAATLRRPDVVLASSPPLPIATVGEIVAKRFGSPWVLEVRDIWPESAVAVGWLAPNSVLYRLLDRLARRHAACADAVITPTPGVVDGVRAHGATHVDVVPGAVHDLPPDPNVRARVRRELDVGADECLFVYVGAIGAANAVDLLFDAVRRVDESVQLRVLIVGAGSDRDRLARRLVAEPLDRVRLLGAVPKERVGELLAAADVCLHLLRNERVFETALPTKVLEYWGSHRAFITTVAGLPKELATASGGAFAADVDELAEQLRRWALAPAAERAERGEQAFRYGIEHYGPGASVDRLEAVLRRALRPRVA
jgi:colanic acid biosynthesis glycosyl transferase WcaI